MKIKQILLIASLLLSTQLISAQSASQFKKLLKKSVKEIHDSKGKKLVSAYQFKEYITTVPEVILKEIPKYESDLHAYVRQLVYDLYYEVGRKNEKPEIRQEAVYHLVKGCIDSEPGLRTTAANKLKYFFKSDFSEVSENVLITYLSENQEIYKNTVRLTGFLDMEEQIPKLHDLLNDTSLQRESIRWEIQITLARLGDEEMILYCTDLARSKGVNDRIIHFLLKDLVYTRQKQAFEYLLDILDSNAKNCRPANPDLYDPIVCAYRIMELLAPVTENFPFETYPGTSQLKADNYDEALETVRQWFSDHPDYVIKKDTF